MQGPCLRHCYSCSPVTVLCARLAFVYALSCALYLLLTRRVGTPFLDSLTESQRQIKAASAKVRRDAFATAVAMSVAAVAMLKPFRPTQ